MTTPAHVQSILDGLKQVRKTGTGWTACCPGHSDRHPSLSIGTGAGGRVLLSCLAGCPTEAVLAGMGLTFRDLFPPEGGDVVGAPRRALPKPPLCPEAEPEPARDLDAEAAFANGCRDDLNASEDALGHLWRRRAIGPGTALDWGVGVTEVRRDAAGTIIGVTWTLPVLHHEGARTLIGVKLHRDPPRPGQSKGGWHTRGRAALFPLLEAQALDAGAEVILAPGELKALAYVSAGLPATSPTTGEATRWTPDMAARFRGLTVIVDRDQEDSDVARRFVDRAVRALHGVAHSVEVCAEGEAGA